MAITIKEKGPQYFEGILQLRNPTPELIKYVRKQIAKDPHAWIAKEEKVRGGIDLYISSQKFLRALGKKLKERFTGVMKTSRKLHTRHRVTSKALYRAYVMFRPLKLKRGDIINIRGEEFKVILIENQVTLKSPKTGKKIRCKIEEIEKYLK